MVEALYCGCWVSRFQSLSCLLFSCITDDRLGGGCLRHLLFTRSSSRRGSRHPRANAVAPGPIWTPLLPVDDSGRTFRGVRKETSLRRPACRAKVISEASSRMRGRATCQPSRRAPPTTPIPNRPSKRPYARDYKANSAKSVGVSCASVACA